MSNETTSPEVATKASGILRDAQKLADILGSIQAHASQLHSRCDEFAALGGPIIAAAKSSAGSALTQKEGKHLKGQRLYAVEVRGYSTTWRFEQLATEDQAKAWRDDGLHVEALERQAKGMS